MATSFGRGDMKLQSVNQTVWQSETKKCPGLQHINISYNVPFIHEEVCLFFLGPNILHNSVHIAK